MPDFATGGEKGDLAKLEDSLRNTVFSSAAGRHDWHRWSVENQSAIAHYNASIAAEGTFAQQVQSWLDAGEPF